MNSATRFYFIYLFGVLRHFQHCTGHITMGNWKGRGNQYIQFARVVYCKLPTNGKQLPAFPLKAMTGIGPRPQRWEARVFPLCHRGPPIALLEVCIDIIIKCYVIHSICVFAKIQKFGFICIEGDVKFLAKMICYT